jgi:hypothetical protein
MKRTIVTLTLASMLVGTAIYAAKRNTNTGLVAPVAAVVTPPAVPAKKPQVDLVIALDTSGSMSGLINAARQKLWDIVNEVGQADPAPDLRVALLTYGSGGSEADGFVIVQSDLTTDIDSIYGKLFALRTSGGTEYVGRVVHRALNELSWSDDPDTLRQIFVAGNESADQDRTHKVADVMKRARAKDVFVNTIYCGNEGTRDAISWNTVAKQGNGMFASIDHNNGTVAMQSPYDAKLAALSSKLNRTYVGYGMKGRRAKNNQVKQDKNALSSHSSTAASRALAKAGGAYNASGWDLIDARKTGKLNKIAKAEMPAEVQGFSNEEMDDYLDKKEAERNKLRAEIKTLSSKRKSYVTKEMKAKGKSEKKSFDYNIRRAVQAQAAAKKIKLKK